MIKKTNVRIAITLTKEELEKLNIISAKTGYSKSVLIKEALLRFIYIEYEDIKMHKYKT